VTYDCPSDSERINRVDGQISAISLIGANLRFGFLHVTVVEYFMWGKFAA
jgi:hypothetical protein